MEERDTDSPCGIRCSSQLVRIKSEQTEIHKCINPNSGRIVAGSSPGQQDECAEKSANAAHFLPPNPHTPIPPLFARSPSLSRHSSRASLSRFVGKTAFEGKMVITVLLHFRSHVFTMGCSCVD